MASKPRNISSSPTNLSPSRIAIRNSCSTSAAARSSASGGSKKGTSSPIGSAGRTPQTRRKELALQNSPQGSPKNNSTNAVQKKSNSTTGGNNSVRKSSSKNNNNNKRSRGSRASASGSTTQVPTLKLREETKFDGLWDVKTIDNGLIRIPTQCLEELISKEGIEKFYEVEDKPVASGLFATVRKCVHRETGITYAAKFSSRVRYGVNCYMEILHEIAMLSVCTDSNKIVHLKDVFQNEHEIILVLEYAPGGDFQSVLDEDMVPFEEDVQGFLRQILEALDFIHDRNIAHLDIKPQNIVLMGQFPNCEIKLCDLEVARVIKEDEEITEIIGTPDYVAPEILEWKPITLSADIWSLGVTTYVLLTGFSPFGGDTDQETLRNITTATLDFPPELFEGVSDMAKEFISDCLVRDPKKRLNVKQCLAHAWLATEEEPPSPSPLMLKIPTPDLSEPIPKISSGHSHGGGRGHGHGGGSDHGHGGGSGSSLGGSLGGGSRRSCQTCRDKITERKRYLSKSREAIFEKVAQSNLKKSLSKSRERLCDMRLTLSKSRDNLGSEVTKVMSRQQDKLYGLGFKSLSKSQEVISAALGGVPMKRMINGAVSDISHALNSNRSGSELPSPSVDFIYVPGSGIIVPQSELMKINSGSLQVLPLTESGRSTPASQASVTTVQDLPMAQAEVIVSNANVVVVTSPHTSNTANLVETPLIEVSEEEEESKSNPSRNSSSSTLNGERASSVSKDIKESQNYEKQKQTKKRNSKVFENNPLELELKNIKLPATTTPTPSCSLTSVLAPSTPPILKETASVGIQVNLIQAAALPTPNPPGSPSVNISASSPSLARKLANLAQEPEEISLERHLLRNNKSSYESKTLPRRKSSNDVSRLMKQSSMEEKPAPLRRGYTHDQMLGMDQKSNPAWREELNKIRSQKPFKISELIGTFDKRPDDNVNSEESAEDLAALKQQRRGSLQIQFGPGDTLGQLAKAAEDLEKKKEAMLKTQRRKSTPTLLSNNLETMKIQDQIVDILKTASEEKDDITEQQQQLLINECEEEKKDDQPENKKNENTNNKANVLVNQQQQRKSVLMHQQHQKKWDYFEIDHPKAISDKKLQQLKAKFSRRRTEGNLNDKSYSIKEENEDLLSPESETAAKPMLSDRSKSVPISLGQPLQGSGSLNLSIDPLTGVCLGPASENEMDIEEVGRQVRKISTDSGEESATDSSSRRSSRSSIQQRRRSSHLSDIYEQKPQQTNNNNSSNDAVDIIVEVRIDPLTGKISTEEKKRRRLSVEIMDSTDSNGLSNGPRVSQGDHGDDGFISLPHTPTDLGLLLDPKLKIATSSISSTASTNSASTSHLADDGIFTSSEETLSHHNLMKKATSLEACNSSSNIPITEDSSRPASAASNTFVKAMEKFSVASRKVSSSSTETDSSAQVLLPSRRQSSPMIRPSSS